MSDVAPVEGNVPVQPPTPGSEPTVIPEGSTVFDPYQEVPTGSNQPGSPGVKDPAVAQVVDPGVPSPTAPALDPAAPVDPPAAPAAAPVAVAPAAAPAPPA